MAPKAFWAQSETQEYFKTQEYFRAIKITGHIRWKSKCRLLACIGIALPCCLSPVLFLAPEWTLGPCCSLVSSSSSGPCINFLLTVLLVWTLDLFTSCLVCKCWWTHWALPTMFIPCSTAPHYCPSWGNPHLPACSLLGSSCLLLPLDSLQFYHFSVASSLLSVSLGTCYQLSLLFLPLLFFCLHWLPWQLHAWISFWCAVSCFSYSWYWI